MPDPIDLFTANPDENNPATLPAQIDLFVQEIIARIPQLNAAFTALNFNSTNSTSATSVAIGLGTKNFTAGTGKSYVVGMSLKIARTSDGTKWMYGEVLSYNSGTGDLSVDVREKSALGGTFSDWTISLASTLYAVNPGLNRVVVHTPTGYGSTNTMVPVFSTTLHNDGDAITYTTSAANGASFTLNETGIYLAYFHGFFTGTNQMVGASLNSARLTTSIASLVFSAEERVLIGSVAPSAGQPSSGFGFIRSAAGGDVVRPHTAGGAFNATANQSIFGIIKVL